MKIELKSNGFMLRLLLLVNAILIGAMFFLLRDVKHEPRKADCSESSIRCLNTDALNSITIKLM